MKKLIALLLVLSFLVACATTSGIGPAEYDKKILVIHKKPLSEHLWDIGIEAAKLISQILIFRELGKDISGMTFPIPQVNIEGFNP